MGLKWKTINWCSTIGKVKLKKFDPLGKPEGLIGYVIGVFAVAGYRFTPP